MSNSFITYFVTNKSNEKNTLLALTIAVSSLTYSCAPVMKVGTSKSMDIYGAGVVQRPVVAEMSVKIEKVSGTASGIVADVESLKQDAIADALKKSGADVLVEPQYDIESKGARATVTVKGFPANYTSFKPITKEDMAIIEAGTMQKAKTSSPSVAPRKKILGLF